jgi:hypothetical protein
VAFSFFSDLINPTKYDMPDAPVVDVTKEQQNAVQGNLASFDVAKELAQKYNDFMAQQMQDRLAKTQPYLAGLENQIAGNYASQLRGEISTSDAAASQRGSMAKALGLGLGGSQAGGALALRNLGLTQYGVQQQAQQGAVNFMGSMKNIKQTPMFDFSNVFMSSADRVSAQFRNSENAWNVQNQQNQMAAQPEPWMKAFAGLGDTALNVGGILGSNAMARNWGSASMGGGLGAEGAANNGMSTAGMTVQGAGMGSGEGSTGYSL